MPFLIFESRIAENAERAESQALMEFFTARIRYRHTAVDCPDSLMFQDFDQQSIKSPSHAARGNAGIKVDGQFRAPLVGFPFLQLVRIGVSAEFSRFHADQIGMSFQGVGNTARELVD